MIGTVNSSSIEPNRSGDASVMMCDCEMSEPDDISDVEIFCPSGEKHNPVPGSRVLTIRVSSSYLVGVAFDDGIVPDVLIGEKKIYSIDPLTKQVASVIHLKTDGEMVLNEGTDYAVKYQELETAFNQLKSDFDAQVVKYNAHIHVTTATVGPSTTVFGVISPTVALGSPSTADITPAKVDKVRL